MNESEMSSMGKKLTEEQIKFYNENGYLSNIPPVFNADEVRELNEGFIKLKSMLYDGEIPSDIQQWHRTSRWIYDICTHPAILDYVEDILGPNFFLWANEFITKAPHSPKTVPWHQDAYYWATSSNTVTVWLAFEDVDEANGAMKVIPGTHKDGIIKHKIADEDSILSFELESGSYSEESAVSICIPAGGFSLHDDAIIHGSPANISDRWRIGFVSRYSSTDVKADLSKNPDFKAYMVRGVDEYHHNPLGTVPTELFARPEASTRRIRKTK